MKIQLLFEELEKIKESSKEDFKNSGMINRFKEMRYGFFPLGWGILTDNNKTNDGPPTDEIEEGGVMVLGNDVKEDSGGIGELKGTTIRNILKYVPALATNKTFFTNLNLGIRLDDGCYKGTTMTKRICNEKPFKIKPEYSDLCFKFFIKQLELIKPRKVICLGHEVKNALIDSGIPFHQWKAKSDSLGKLYSKKENNHIIKNKELKEIEFIVIPHPCYLVNFLKPPYLEKLNTFLEAK